MVKTFKEMDRLELEAWVREVAAQLDRIEFPSDTTYLLLVYGPDEKPWTQGFHNTGPQTAPAVKQFIEYAQKTFEED